jgi:hypothetical protein
LIGGLGSPPHAAVACDLVPLARTLGAVARVQQGGALSVAQLIRMRGALARALSTDDVNELGLRTGQSERLRTITPHRLFLSMIAGLAGGQVESLADLLRELDHQNDVTVAYKAFYNRLARPGFATFMHQMFDRLLERLCVQTLAPDGRAAISQLQDILIQAGSSFALKNKLLLRRGVFGPTRARQGGRTTVPA